MDTNFLLNKRILLVDDETAILDMVSSILTEYGFTHLRTATNMNAALTEASEYKPELAILDVMLPDGDGFTLLEKLRQQSDYPVLFLTARGSEEDVVRGLTCGGDDYLVKPYSLRELKARVDLLIRRRSQFAKDSSGLVLAIGNLTIDKIAHKAFYREQDLCLANREYEVLLYLAEHPDRDITFEELGCALFGVYRESDRRSVMVNVSRLRKRFEGNYELENRIETVWSKGYRFLKGGV